MKISEYLPNKKCCSYKHNCKVDCNCSFKVETLKVSCSIANAEEKKRRKICCQHFIYNFSFQFDLHFYPLMILKPFIYWNSAPKFLLSNYYPLLSHCWSFSISFLSHFYPIAIPFIFNSYSISITYPPLSSWAEKLKVDAQDKFQCRRFTDDIMILVKI